MKVDCRPVDLNPVVERLATRAGSTEADIQSDVRTVLLYGGLELENTDLVVLESPVGGGRRIDVEAGTAVFEVKKDLTNDTVHERAVEQLAGYLRSRTEATGLIYVGVLTDGTAWELYRLNIAGEMEASTTLTLSGGPQDVPNLTLWLEGVMATAQGISPTSENVDRLLGSLSPGFELAVADLQDIYVANQQQPEVVLKRELWSSLLKTAFGTHFEDTDELFVLHTYLVITAELIAHTVVGLEILGEPAEDLLSGEQFRTVGLGGVVEADFFDWPAAAEHGKRFVGSQARRVARFDWSSVSHDILKHLYESVIDTETRHRLGEYYTPDWLAEGVVERVVDSPLTQRVLDPACGSGTFLFWAVRRYLEAADSEGVPNAESIAGAVANVAGIDLHPVAVALARVTYVLAIGNARLTAERPEFSVPVYVGDSIRWEQDDSLLQSGGIRVHTTDGAELFDQELFFPERVVADASAFDRLVAELAHRASSRERGSAIPPISGLLNRRGVLPDDQEPVENAFKSLCRLHDDGRNHIWGYYIRNVARPLWFTRENNRVDVLVGNPPWLAYRFMPDQMQESYRRLATARGIWSSGRALVTQQDLSDLFVVRSVEQYLKMSGKFGFVMPASTLSRQQFEGFRAGDFPLNEAPSAVTFGVPWDLRSVQPHIFPVPACVVFGERTRYAHAMPTEADRIGVRIPTEGARFGEITEEAEVDRVTIAVADPNAPRSPYSARFTQGFNAQPRYLVLVRDEPPGTLGVPMGTRRVRSARSPLEDRRYRDLPDQVGVVEEQYVRKTYLGAQILPFGLLPPELAVVPANSRQVIPEQAVIGETHPHLADWWSRASDSWLENRTDASRLSLWGQVNFQGKLEVQIPSAERRVIYTASGNRIAAARLNDASALAEHSVYWATVNSDQEGLYLVAVLNSDGVHERVEPLMAEGLFGARHIDSYVWHTMVPQFDPNEDGHIRLAELGANAEALIETTDLGDAGFQRKRRTARDLLRDQGLMAQIDEVVLSMLPARY